MAKRVVKKIQRKKNNPSNFEKNVDNFENKISKIEDDIDKDVKVVENWVIQRRKFFIKLGLVIILILILMLILALIQG